MSGKYHTTPHCRDCQMHHNAGHPKNSKVELLKYNDWCCKFGKHAQKIVGHCKNVNGKVPILTRDKFDVILQSLS